MTIELLLVITVLMAALLTLSRSLGSAVTLSEVNRETALATDSAREMLEMLQGAEDFSQIFALFNEDPADDPGGAGTAPGNTFVVDGLDPADDDPDGIVGEIRFPAVWGVAGLELREDLVDADLGVPRDLTGDGITDAADHSGDYLLLPVQMRLRWKGATGVREITVQTLIADL